MKGVKAKTCNTLYMYFHGWLLSWVIEVLCKAYMRFFEAAKQSLRITSVVLVFVVPVVLVVVVLLLSLNFLKSICNYLS
jgi:hypothetical protein